MAGMSLPAPGSVLACPVCLEAAPRSFMHVDGRDYWRCDACEATFVPPQQWPTVAAERAEYRRHCNDPDDPARPGWGGQYRRDPDGWWRDLPHAEGADPRTTVSRWRPAFQADFARRMAWTREAGRP